MERPEDAKKFATTFKPEWLRKPELAPILNEIFLFVKKYGVPPSLPTLHLVVADKDKEAYDLRYKGVLEGLSSQDVEQSKVLYTIDKARDFSIIRSFQAITSETAFLELQSDMRGSAIVDIINQWKLQFDGAQIDRTMSIKEAVDHLVQASGFVNEFGPISCGIKPLDDWCGGGLRPRNLAIVLGGTGQGKSVVLVNIALKIASVEQKKVWFVTNELALEEQTERFLARMTGEDMHKIMADPGICYGDALGRHWGRGLGDNLWITDVNREVCTNDLEAEMARIYTLTGWKPDVIVLDYMERMKPNETGYKRDASWNWLGAIAGDLVRLDKRHNLLIWTAGQANRGGMSGDNPQIHQSQGSIKHLQEATFVCSVVKDRHPNPVKEDVDVMKFQGLKFRQSRDTGNVVCLEANLSQMLITNNEIELPTIDQGDDEEESPTPKKRKQKKWRENKD